MKVLFGSIITNGYGKIGGMFIKRLPSGHSLNVLPKTKSKAILRTTQNLRLSVRTFQGWSYIGSEAQEQYRAIATSTIVVDKFGNNKYLTARQTFVKLNRPLLEILGDFINVASYGTAVPIGSFSVLDIDFGDEDLDFNYIREFEEGKILVRIDKLANENVTARYINSILIAWYSAEESITMDLWSSFILKYPYAKIGETYQVSFSLFNNFGVRGPVSLFKWTF